jgi:hypothetical protein
MKYLTLNLNDHVRIEIENSITGKETIRYNDEIVSEEATFWGGTHRFEKMEDGELARYEVRVSVKPIFRIGFDIYRNDKMILLA